MYQSCPPLSTLDQKAENGAVGGKKLIRHAQLVHALQKRREVLLLCKLNADKRGAVLAVVLLGVLEERDVVGGAKCLVEEAAECPRPLGEIDHEVVLQPLIDEAALDDFRITADVVVAAREDADHRLALQLRTEQVECRDGERARRLRDDAVALIERYHFLTHLSLGDEEHIVGDLLREREREVSDRLYRGTVDERVYGIERDGLSRLQRLVHGGSALGLDADNLSLRALCLEIGTRARNETAAADGDDQIINRFSELLQDLRADGALPRDDQRIIERMHESHSFRLGHFPRRLVRFVERIARELDGDVFAAERMHAVYLLPRRITRHENRSADFERGTTEGDALRVIAGGSAHDAALFLGGCEQTHTVVRAAQFVRAYDLQVLAFEEYARAVFFREAAIPDERRLFHDAAQSFARFVDH